MSGTHRVALLASLVGTVGILAPALVSDARLVALLVIGGMHLGTRRARALGPRWRTVLACLAAQLPWLAVDPWFSDDVARYLWDGAVARHGIDPYAHAPLDPMLRGLDSALRARVNHPSIPTVYPLVAQSMFAFAGALGLPGWKLLLLAVVHATALWLRDDEHAQWMLHPLVVAEVYADAHLDVIVGMAILVLSDTRSSPLQRLVAFVIATGTKLVGLLAWPTLPRRQRWLALLACLTVLPLVTSHERPGAVEYGHRWRGNAGLYAVLEHGLTIASHEGADAAGHVHAPLIERLRGTHLDPRPGASLHARDVGRLLARALVVATVIALAVVSRWPAALLAGLLLAPQLHPWYVLWVLPVAISLRLASAECLAWLVCALHVTPLDPAIAVLVAAWTIALAHFDGLARAGHRATVEVPTGIHRGST